MFVVAFITIQTHCLTSGLLEFGFGGGFRLPVVP